MEEILTVEISRHCLVEERQADTQGSCRPKETLLKCIVAGDEQRTLLKMYCLRVVRKETLLKMFCCRCMVRKESLLKMYCYRR